MLQNVLRKLLSNKHCNSSADIKRSPDVSLKRWQSHEMIHKTSYDIILRQQKCKNKAEKRVISCPDATDLKLMYRTMDIALVDLKRICEEGTNNYSNKIEIV